MSQLAFSELPHYALPIASHPTQRAFALQDEEGPVALSLIEPLEAARGSVISAKHAVRMHINGDRCLIESRTSPSRVPVLPTTKIRREVGTKIRRQVQQHRKLSPSAPQRSGVVSRELIFGLEQPPAPSTHRLIRLPLPRFHYSRQRTCSSAS